MSSLAVFRLMQGGLRQGRDMGFFRRDLMAGLAVAALPVRSRAQGLAYPTAAINWPGHKAQIFFRDGSYVRFDLDKGTVDPGYPQPVNDKTWPGLADYAQTIVAGCDGPAGKAYFFVSDGTYLRYDTKADRVDGGYPKPVDNGTWPGLGNYGSSIAAALNWKDGKIQFFLTDGRYIRYDVAADRADPGYPQPVNDDTWPGLAAYRRDLAAMINFGDAKAFMFLKNGQVIRYDIPKDRVDPGYPR